jgi:hypothetical protein
MMIALIGTEFMAWALHLFVEAGIALHRRQTSASLALTSDCRPNADARTPPEKRDPRYDTLRDARPQFQDAWAPRPILVRSAGTNGHTRCRGPVWKSAWGRIPRFRPGTGGAAAQCGDLTHHTVNLLHRRPRGNRLEFFQPAWVSRQAGGQLASNRPLVPDRGKAPIKAPRRIGRCAPGSGDAGDRQSASVQVQHPAHVAGHTLLEIVRYVNKYD